MKLQMILLSFCLSCTPLLAKETWTLVDKQDREIVVDQLFYDGVNLSVRRVGAYSKMKIAPEMLSKQCWEGLNEEMAKAAVISLKVVRRTKTSSNSDRTNTSGYYSYSTEEKNISKRSFFGVELSSSSHFVSEVTIEYFILSEDEVDCGHMVEELTFAEPLETGVSKTISHTERNYKSSYGCNHSYKDGDSKASIVVFVYDPDGEEIAQYATSNKILNEFRGLERGLRSRMNSRKKNQKSGALDQMTIHKSEI